MQKSKIYRKIYKNRHKRELNFNIEKLVFYIFIAIFCLAIYFIMKRTDNKMDIPIKNISAFQISSDVMIQLRELSKKYELDFSEMLTVYSLKNNFFEEKQLKDESLEKEFLINYNQIKANYPEKEFKVYYNLINNIILEIKNFPINQEYSGKYIYGDSWGAERTYGGKRIHQGTDIMDKENIDGNIHIVSMTSGTIENLGWNEKGGYRVGIRTENGNYYYYAHLSDFAPNLQKGSKIEAGQLIGYMGSTGYSKIEGTKGNFAVHLHIGIEVDSGISKDPFWINPYPFLTYIEDSKKD